MIRNGRTYYYHADGLGSIIAITDYYGNVVQRYEYDSFGNITYIQDPNFKQPYTYTGREYDEESGLYYYRARYYDAKVGRFLQEDPFRGFLRMPQTQNLYPYTQNNPVNYTDPDGEMSIIGGVILAGYSIGAVLIFKDCMNRCQTIETKAPGDSNACPSWQECAKLCAPFALLLGFGADPIGSSASTAGGKIGEEISE